MTAARLALEALRWLAGVWLLWRIPRCRPGDGAPAAVAVVVPARDEEATLPRLLASLAAQDPSPREVVVVDDSSSDATATVGRRGGAEVVAAGALPRGWTGKSWACWKGVAATSSPTLVFLDADTELAAGGLARVVAEQARRGGLVSVQPFHVMRRPYERLSAFFNVVSMMGVDAFDPRSGRRPPRGAFGPCLAVGRADYHAVGGHRAVRDDVVEDVALARRFTAAGLPVTCLGGRGTVSFRMYPGGVGQLVEGWTKNFAAGAAATRPLTFLLVSVWLSGCITAAWSLAAAALGAGTVDGPQAVALHLAYAGQLAWMLSRIGSFGPATPLAFPIPLAFFLAIFARSVLVTAVGGEVRWRGRRVPTGRRASRTAADEWDGGV